MPTFQVGKKGGGSSLQVIDRTEITLGRSKHADIVLDSHLVSRQHARIVFEGGRATVTDLDTSNGTYVNGRKIAGKVEISSADKVYIGDFVVQFEDEATSATEAPRDPGSQTAAQAGVSSNLLRCENCNGPLDAPDPSRPTMTCPYCGFQSANRLYRRG